MEFCVFDQECLSLGISANRIIELAAVALRPNGDEIGTFCERINPGCPIPPFSTSIHHITDAMVAEKPSFAGAAFVRFLNETFGDRTFVMVGHNCAALDIPLLLHQCQEAKIEFPAGAKYWLDTRYLCAERLADPPANFKLGVIYSHLFHEELKGAHGALEDAKATARILLHQSLWPFRGKVKDFSIKVALEKNRILNGKKIPKDLSEKEVMDSDGEDLEEEEEEGGEGGEEEGSEEEGGRAEDDGWGKEDKSLNNKTFVGPL